MTSRWGEVQTAKALGQLEPVCCFPFLCAQQWGSIAVLLSPDSETPSGLLSRWGEEISTSLCRSWLRCFLLKAFRKGSDQSLLPGAEKLDRAWEGWAPSTNLYTVTAGKCLGGFLLTQSVWGLYSLQRESWWKLCKRAQSLWFLASSMLLSLDWFLFSTIWQELNLQSWEVSWG